MADRGFPQFLEYQIPDEAVTVVDDIGLDPHTFGPVTESEARTQGYSPLLGLPPDFPQVVAQDEAFDRALAECRQRAWSGLDPAAEDTVRSLERLAESLHNAFMDTLRASDEFQALHDARASCLAEAGFPARDGVGVWLRPGPESFPIEFGEVEISPGSNPEVTAGGVVVVYPPDRRYVPTRQEVALALADVECRRRLDFDRQVADVAAAIQRDLLADVEANIAELRITLDRIVAGIGRGGA